MSRTERSPTYRQIITRAVVGKGHKFSQLAHTFRPPEKMHTILGAWVINHKYDCQRRDDVAEVEGSYDLNIWYSTGGNTETAVLNEKVDYKEIIPLTFMDHHVHESTIKVTATVAQAPNCIEAAFTPHREAVQVRVEKELLVELIGETKMCIAVYPLSYAEAEDKEHHGIEDSLETRSFEDLDPDLLLDDLDNN